MAPKLVATASIHWLDPASGGRKAPPSGSIYAATGQFADRKSGFFSIILRLPLEKASRKQSPSESLPVDDKPDARIWDEAEIGFLAPELVEKLLAPGVKLSIAEGPQIVAECLILELIPPANAIDPIIRKVGENLGEMLGQAQ